MRPFVPREGRQKPCMKFTENIITIDTDIVGDHIRHGPTMFKVDAAMDSSQPDKPGFVTQQMVYDTMGRRMIDHVKEGYNTCLFCYGQTGTGKTTTIMGNAYPVEEQGLLLRLMYELFADVKRVENDGGKVQIQVQMLEVYNERINDLLSSSQRRKPVDIHVHPELGVYMKGAVAPAVSTFRECVRLIEYGNTMKTVAATAMNAQSSRGHTIFKMNLERRGGSDNQVVRSEIYFADLAGRENERTTQVSGDRLAELGFINKSLMWLATCIQHLGKPRSSVGSKKKMDLSLFRNSKLTLLLANALSGNSKTAMIGTVSPALSAFEESYSTMKFAQTVKHIKLEAKAACAVDKAQVVKQLQDEVAEVRRELARARDGQDVAELTAQLEAAKQLVSYHGKTWEQIENETKEQARKIAEEMVRWHFQQRGVQVEGVDFEDFDMSEVFSSGRRDSEFAFPYFANFSEDIHQCFKLRLHVPADGQEYKVGAGKHADLTLPPGLDVPDVVCYVTNRDGKLLMRPANAPASGLRTPSRTSPSSRRASIEVNRSRVLARDWKQLNHLDSIVFGHNMLYYVFLAPATPEEIARLRPHAALDGPEFSSEDLLKAAIGQERAENPSAMQMARQLLRHFQAALGDTEGETSLRSFLQSLQRAQRMVDEANAISAKVRPNIEFELFGQTDLLSMGAGQSPLPELGVRVLRHISRARARWLMAVQKIQRRTFAGVVRGLQDYAMIGGDYGELVTSKVLHIWTWEKFLVRLDLMRQVRLDFLSDPLMFKIDPLNDPWLDSHPHAIHELQEKDRLRNEQRAGEQRVQSVNNLGIALDGFMYELLEQTRWQEMKARKREQRLVDEKELLEREVKALRAQLAAQSARASMAEVTSSDYGHRVRAPRPKALCAGIMVKVVKAVGLNAFGGRPGSLADAYCIVQVPGKDGTERRTRVVPSSCEPSWEFSLPLDTFQEGDALEFQVWDSDVWPKTGGLLGTARIEADIAMPGSFHALPLTSDTDPLRIGNPCGELHVEIRPMPGENQGHQQRFPGHSLSVQRCIELVRQNRLMIDKLSNQMD